ncbi:NADP-dependent oxidoreductase [Halococcus saccharolyticus]|uniref:NADP-dependent oxidoreductase n=1 Tax=Halococcus saccharolyticus TaxID=62319 RepID=UPI000677C92B|nr:NADP-dependent oxidoreductase [Halococcus saccharolyticus]
MTDTNRQFVLGKRPDGKPDRDTFELEERDVPEPRHGEVLVRTLYLSVDPYMRGRMRDRESYADPWEVGDRMAGHVVGEVIESAHDDWAAGEFVFGEGFWSEYAALDGDDLTPVDPSLENLSLPAYLGVLGMPGRTAYFGTLDVLEPDPGDTVVVSGAAGAVGSTVGQIASLAGARVVGFAGSDEKVRYLEDDLGFDAGINYKTTDDYRRALADAAPNGVDAYFDNVGGPISDAVFTQLNVDARVAICGQIALYNEEGVPTGPRKLPQLIAPRAHVEGFLVFDYATRFEHANDRLRDWVANDDIEHRESIVEGFANAPDAFLGLFEGDNIGKQVVKVAEPSES